MPKIRLIITGGTIDKDYNPITGVVDFSKTHLAEMLQQANHLLDIELQQVCLKDSLEMNDEDRELIAEACIQAKEDLIVITHGTDTMTLTANHLKTKPELANKTIVLTGAMRPFKLGNSDAMFNLGTASMAVQMAKSGIYLVMNGQLHLAGNVNKDLQAGVFRATSE